MKTLDFTPEVVEIRLDWYQLLVLDRALEALQTHCGPGEWGEVETHLAQMISAAVQP